MDLLQHIEPPAQLRRDDGWLSAQGYRHLLPVSLGRRAAATLCAAASRYIERAKTWDALQFAMLVNTRLIILVSVLQLLLFPPHCHWTMWVF